MTQKLPPALPPGPLDKSEFVLVGVRMTRGQRKKLRQLAAENEVTNQEIVCRAIDLYAEKVAEENSK